MSQALEDKPQRETPAIDRLLSYINEYRSVMDWLKAKHPDVFQEWNNSE